MGYEIQGLLLFVSTDVPVHANQRRFVIKSGEEFEKSKHNCQCRKAFYRSCSIADIKH